MLVFCTVICLVGFSHPQKAEEINYGFLLDVIFTGSHAYFASVTEDTSSRVLCSDLT